MSQTTSSSAREPGAQAGEGLARIGCSGWHYKGWRGRVYPESLHPADWLRAYARRFTTVELNNSFYRLPAPATFAAWRGQVPAGFRFAVKASRFLTHIKRLREPDAPLARLLANAAPLGPALGPILYQLPPRWFPDADRLRAFLAALPRCLPGSRQRLHHVVEMRDSRGYEPWVLELLDQYGVTLCVHDMPDSEAPLLAIGPILYVRLHGHGVRYGGSYPEEVLAEWADWLHSGLGEGRNAYIYFNNDVDAHAVADAERLRALVVATGSRVATPRRRRANG